MLFSIYSSEIKIKFVEVQEYRPRPISHLKIEYI